MHKTPPKIAIVGGDKRELYLAEHLLSEGYDVHICGFENYASPPAPHSTDVLETVSNADAVIMPLAGLDAQLAPKSPYSNNPPKVNVAFFQAMPKGIPVFVGWAREEVFALAQDVTLVEVGNDDELAIFNSIPTAEGAIAIAMEKTPITIHGSSSMVIGFGRSAISLARMLQGIGAEVTVAARSGAALARAHEMGFKTCLLDQLSSAVAEMDFIFNTVPALVLPAEAIKNATRCQLIVDIASGEGGTDWQAASQYGIEAVLALGLPGRVAPVTAGKVLSRIYPRFLNQYGVNRG